MSMRLDCPNCAQPLASVSAQGAVSWRCGACRGASIGLGLLRRLAREDGIVAAWQSLWKDSVPGRTPCPSCRSKMSPIRLAGGLETAACRPCQLIWFEGEELRRFAPRRQESSATPTGLRRAAQRAVAIAAQTGHEATATRLQAAMLEQAKSRRKRRTGSLDALVAALVS